MSRHVNRRVVLSGFALPAVAGLGLATGPAFAGPRQPIPLPGTDLPGDLPKPELPVSLPTFEEATHQTVLTPETAEALAGAGIDFLPAPGSSPVDGAALPSTQLPLSVGMGTLDLLLGAVHFDGGFSLTDGARELTFSSFGSQLAESLATSLLWVDGEPGERIPALTYDLLTSTIEVATSTLTVRGYSLFLTPEAVEAIQGVFPSAPVSTEQPFAQGMAAGTYLLPVTAPA